MKTNQLMQVRIGDYVQPINHKTMTGNLNTLWDYGNSLRELNGKMPLRLDKFLLSPDTVDFMLELERRLNNENLSNIKIEYGDYGRRRKVAGEWSTLEAKRGKNGGTWAHLLILLRAASHLDSGFGIDFHLSILSLLGDIEHIKTMGNCENNNGVFNNELESLYVINFGNVCKIGISKRPFTRIKRVCTSSGRTPISFAIYDKQLGRNGEDWLLNFYKEVRTIGEYVTTDFYNVIDVIKNKFQLEPERIWDGSHITQPLEQY